MPDLQSDGNERVGLTNRGIQNGPVGGMGQRATAQGYDLNRDHTKLDAPETRSLARMLSLYDPTWLSTCTRRTALFTLTT